MSKKETSQKLFTVQFLDADNVTKTTKVPARKGKCLKDVISPILLNHELSFSTFAVFLESSNTPLPLTNDTYPYGGQTLHVKTCDSVNVDKRIIGSTTRSDNKKDPKKRFSELLQYYDTHGLEESGDEVDSTVQRDKVADDFYLETSWKDIIGDNEIILDKQRVQQEAIWELFSSEISYLKDLKVIIEIFRRCFEKVREAGYLEEIDKALIFANIDEIYKVNCTFWRLLKAVVEELRTSKQAINPKKLIKAFNEFEDLFQPYITFCNADTSNMKLPNYTPDTNEMINKFISWCDNHEQCKRIKLQGFLIKPLQRVTKYSLLLRAILNKTEDESERNIIAEIMSRVETFVSKINKAVHMRQENEKLISTVSKFDSYKPSEAYNDEAAKIMSEYCTLDLKGKIPGFDDDEKRFILKDGPMKLVEKQGKKDVHAFLFSDVFIIAKLKRNIDKFRIIRQPYRLNKIILRPLKDAGSHLFLYLNEYGILATSFVLQINPNEQAKWLNMIETSKTNYELRLTEYELYHGILSDDLTQSGMSRNKARKQRKSANLPKDSAQLKSDVAIEWSNAKIILCVTMFAVLNIIITKMFGLSTH